MLINYSTKELDLLARIMRAEALAEGDLGMLMVGNVVVNRVLANCLTFKNIRTINDAIYQPNQFSGINNSLFQSSSTTKEKQLAERVLRGEFFIQLLTPCGSMRLKQVNTARLHGMNKIYLEDIKIIAFINQMKVYA